MIRRILLVLALPVTLWGCGFDAPAPSRTPPPPMPEPPLSTFAASLTIPAAQIAHTLDNMTEYRLADLKDQEVKCGPVRCRLNLHANRTGPITVTADNGLLTVKLPFIVQVDAAAPGFLSFLRAKADGQGIAVARTDLSVEPDWRLRSSTSGDVQLDDGHLRLGPMTVGIAQLWNDNAQSLSAPIWRAIDKQLGGFPLKVRVADLWAKAFTPLRVGKAPVSWLVLRPERFEIAEPVVRGGVVTMSLGVEARGHVLVQDQAPRNPPTPLPRAGVFAQPSDTFSFAVPLILPYDRAAQLAMTSLARKPPRVAGMAVTFSLLEILPSGQDVVVGAHVCADPNWDPFGWFASCGTVYLRGTPQYDAASQSIRVANLHYDLASANLMLRAVRALAGDRLAGILQSHLVLDESKEIARLKTQVTAALAKPQGRDISISAQIQSFGAPKFGWTAGGFMALFSASGQVAARVNL